MVPVLTPETSSMCPSVKECYRCMEECPTNAIQNAYRFTFTTDETALGKKQEILGKA
jgi:epoxyqueuosine reductase QueG